MKTILMILLVLASCESTAGYYPVRFEEGSTYTAVETAVYEAGSDTSEVVFTVPAGQFLEIEGFAGETLSADSCEWGWYEVLYRRNNTVLSGFVLDRDLAFASFTLGRDTLFVFRLTGFNTADNAFDGEISVIISGEPEYTEAYRPYWTPYGRMFDYDVAAGTAPPDGLSNAAKLIFLYFGLDAEGVSCREDLLVWTEEGRIVKGPRLLIPANTATNRYTSEVILPSTPGGQNNLVTHHFLAEEYNAASDRWEQVADSTAVYIWTGEEFVR